MAQAPRREFRKNEVIGVPHSVTRPAALPLPVPLGTTAATTRQGSMGFSEEKRSGSQSRSKLDEDKLSVLRAYRKFKGLCFKCGERWSHTHRCSSFVPLHIVEEMWALAQEEEALQDRAESVINDELGQEEQLMAVSKQAIRGSEGKKTIRLSGTIHCQEVLMLVDSGSSASFISSHLLGLFTGVQKLERPIDVKIAALGVLSCKYEIPQCTWASNGHTFKTDLKVLPLGCYTSFWVWTGWRITVPWKLIGLRNACHLFTRERESNCRGCSRR